MIYSYGVSLPGTDHIKTGVVCQDAHKIVNIDSNAAIAAVADGLGSAKYSDVGSKLAVENAIQMCAHHITSRSPPDEILKIIRAGYIAANNAVEKEAASQARSVDQYDTTLSLAVLVWDTLYYGHSGDGGIIALATDGLYMQVTKQQRDSEGRVYPLFFQDKWEFGVYEKKVSAVLLATDGMYEPFFPIYIKNDPVNIYVHLAQFFMDHRKLDITRLGNAAVTARINEYMQNIPAEQVSDDKTVAVLINPSVATAKQPEAYYSQINWAELKRQHDEEWKRAAYPDMYKASKPRKTEQQAFEESLPQGMTFGTPQEKPKVQTQVKVAQASARKVSSPPKQKARVVQKEASSKKRVFLPAVVGLGVFSIAVLVALLIFVLPDGDEVYEPADMIVEDGFVYSDLPQANGELGNEPAEMQQDPYVSGDVDALGDNDDGQEDQDVAYVYENEAVVVPADIPYRAFVRDFGYIYWREGYADIPRGFERLPLSWEDFLAQYYERIIDTQFALSANIRNFGNIYIDEHGNASFPDEFDRDPVLWEDFLDQYGFRIDYTECILRRFPGDVVEQATPYRASLEWEFGVYYVHYDRGQVRHEEIDRFIPPPEWSRFVDLYAPRINFIDYILRRYMERD